MKKLTILMLGVAMFASACVNDAEKHTESEVNTELKDSVQKKDKRGATDATDGDTTSKSSRKP